MRLEMAISGLEAIRGHFLDGNYKQKLDDIESDIEEIRSILKALTVDAKRVPLQTTNK
jgi:hypothetical protein